jgi:hypothetical protein
MKHKFFAALVASAVCAGVVAVSPVAFASKADEKAGAHYTETDLFQFILNGAGPIAQDKPRLVDDANIGRLGITDEYIAKAEAAYERSTPASAPTSSPRCGPATPSSPPFRLPRSRPARSSATGSTLANCSPRVGPSSRGR